jgi:diguanylate cyclase (GGDEF)-like protein
MIRVLLIEDDEDDMVLTSGLLSDIRDFDFELHWERTVPDGLNALRRWHFDVALVDYHIGAHIGLEVLQQNPNPLVPCILLTGQRGRDTDMAAMEAGASDFLVKLDLTPDSLERSIRYACERAQHSIKLQASQEQLVFEATHDPLTRMPNRVLLGQRAEIALTSANLRPGILFLDLDDFKVVNDTQGHMWGDRVLVEVGQRLNRFAVGDVTVARLGGDEFAVLIDHCDGVFRAKDLARDIIQSLTVPIDLDGVSVTIGASIGISLANERTETVTDLMRDADVAMYVAKDKGTNLIEVFQPAMHEAILEAIQRERDLRRAIRAREIVVFYQPVFDVHTREITSFEALARWQHPELGLLGPNLFIQLAEQTGLIVAIGRIVLDAAVAQLMRWRATIPAANSWTMAVNLSPVQIADSAIVATVSDILAKHGAPSDALTLEITESLMVNRGPDAIRTVDQLSDLGIRLAIDDFGTGYSSLSYLQDLPLNVLKVDRSFILRITEPRGKALVAAIVAMAQSLGFKTVAEGVENRHQLELLCEVGCDFAQGSLMSMPVAAEDIQTLLLPQVRLVG